MSWSRISSGVAAFRYYEKGVVFDCAACCFFFDNHIYTAKIIGVCNSKISEETLKILAPTLTFQLGDIQNIPYIESGVDNNYLIYILVTYHKSDWDSTKPLGIFSNYHC